MQLHLSEGTAKIAAVITGNVTSVDKVRTHEFTCQIIVVEFQPI
jgi:hypothetical protein